jgi:lipase chaperone LimK
VEWQNRLREYWADVDRILAQRRGNTKDHDQIREALLTRHFSVDERPAVRALDASRTP